MVQVGRLEGGIGRREGVRKVLSPVEKNVHKFIELSHLKTLDHSSQVLFAPPHHEDLTTQFYVYPHPFLT